MQALLAYLQDCVTRQHHERIRELDRGWSPSANPVVLSSEPSYAYALANTHLDIAMYDVLPSVYV